MTALCIAEIENYIDYLEVHPDEFGHLLNDVFINVTRFFRDTEAWECIASEVIPNIIANAKSQNHIRVWSAGCASGEEAYSIAVFLAEALGLEAYGQQVKIYATDLDESALSEGRQASYSEKRIQGLPQNLRDKYFTLSGSNYVLAPELRRNVIFGRHDLVQDAPISRIDLLICRNTLMYFNSETQEKILSRFHYALNNRGYLFVGKAEMLLMQSNLLRSAFLKQRIFCKIEGTDARAVIPTRQPDALQANEPVISNASTLAAEAFDSCTTAQVVLDNKGTLTMANQLARKTFQLANIDIGRPFHDLEVSYRPLELRSVIEGVTKTLNSVTVPKVVRKLANDQTQIFNVQVDPLLSTGGIMVSFVDITAVEKLEEGFENAIHDLETANAELNSAQEELETTNEELQSTNEELETTNEELQSSNEELETMNEELASTNDELEMTNVQLRSLSTAVSQDRTFLDSVLSSIMSSIIAVDSDMKVLIWNRRSEDLWGLRSEEVIGKVLSTLDTGLPVKELVARIRTNLDKNASFEEFDLEATNRRGRPVIADVRITQISDKGAVTTIIILIDEREDRHRNKDINLPPS